MISKLKIINLSQSCGYISKRQILYTNIETDKYHRQDHMSISIYTLQAVHAEVLALLAGSIIQLQILFLYISLVVDDQD